MKKTQTKTALMKIKVKQVSISSIKKKYSLLLFSFVYFLKKCLEYIPLVFFCLVGFVLFWGVGENLTYSLESLSVCYFKQMQYF